MSGFEWPVGGRFLTRDVRVWDDPGVPGLWNFHPPGGSGPTETDHWTDLLGLAPWSDFDVRLSDSADPDRLGL